MPPIAGGANPGGGGGGDFTPENPIWVPGNIEFNGKTWTNVGVRFKGNSTLRSSWSSGSLKMPFKLDFDEFEGDFPEVRNQRFYGFKQLSLANGQGDPSFLREKTAYHLFEDAGLPAAKTAYCELTMEFGEGPKYLGVYVVIEVIDDTVVPRIFGDDSGNIYEADGNGANLAAGSQSRLQASFLKENNEDEADWSDIRALYDALHATTRTSNPGQWRAGLEKVFDVPVYLEWLALSAAMMHWDTYGGMTHNYYLYNNPKTSKLVWISWDHNNVLGSINAGGGVQQPAGANPAPGGQGPMGGAQAAGGPAGRSNVSLDKRNVAATWPLIRYLMDDPTYYAAYVGHMRDIAANIFTTDKLTARYQKLATLVGPSVAKEAANTAFQSGVQSLTATTTTRVQAVHDFLASV
jgi:spore coat protein CotH